MRKVQKEIELIRDLYWEAAEEVYLEYCDLEFKVDPETGQLYMEEVWRVMDGDKFCWDMLEESRKYRLSFWDPLIFGHYFPSA